MLGDVIGNYRVTAEIGRGGMGVVYKAVHLNMDRTVAIKALLPQFAGDEEVRRRLFQEQRILDRLRHANIVALHDVYSDDENLYLVMEFIEGETLDTVVLNDGPMPFHRVAAMGHQLLSALSYAHSRGVVHRDIKPPNIILTRSEAKLLDFGIAKAADAARLTSPDLVVGSPAYLPPELWKGEDASPRSDVYALGLCLYEGLMGKPALFSNSGWQAYFALHTQTDIPHLGGRLPERLKWLADAIHTATRREPSARFADAKAMLRIFRRNLGVSSEMSLGGPGDPTWGDDATEMLVPGERMRLRDEELHAPRPRPMKILGPDTGAAVKPPPDTPPGTQFIPTGPSAAPPSPKPAASQPAWTQRPATPTPARQAAPARPQPTPSAPQPVPPAAPAAQPPTQPPDLRPPPGLAPPPVQRPWGMLVGAGAALLGALALVVFLLSNKEPPTYTLQVTNTLDQTVTVACTAGGDDTLPTGVELGAGASSSLQLVGLPGRCEGTKADGERVLDWTLDELKRGISTYAVRIGEQASPPPIPSPEDPNRVAQGKVEDSKRGSGAKGSANKGSSGGKKPADPGTDPTPPPAPRSSGCEPDQMQSKAVMGQLGGLDKKCLEGLLSKASKQTEKVEISKVLLVNAQAAKNDTDFMRLAERHLKDFTQADADICYAYALKLKRRGRYSEAIRWAERALENRDRFDDRYASQWTSNLLQIRADSAYADWEKKDKKYLETRSPMDKIQGDKAQSLAKTFAKEWYDFAKESGINVAKAKSRCTSAAGTTSFCQ